jgi:serine/threonine protein kinase/tetratricopeptide (TPR) repeat protein
VPRCPACHRRVPPGARCPRDGALILAAPETPVRPTDVPGYRMGRVVGTGGFAHVWQAWPATGDGDRSPEPAVAIKIGHVATAHAREKIAHEAQALARIGPPYVPALHQHGVLMDGRPYAVMEYLEGPTLASVLAEAPAPLEPAAIGHIGAAVLASLDAVHASGYLHLDLTPENIFLPPGPAAARLVDFGLVRPAHDAGVPAAEQTADAVIAGTIEYTAPERLAGRTDLDARTDLYAFGVILYELLTLRVPFAGDPVSIVRGHGTLRPPPPGAFATVPESLAALCLDCLRKDPADRPASAAAAAERLAAAIREVDLAAAPSALPAGSSALLDVGHQPVVLLGVELAGVDLSAARTVALYKGIVARQEGRRMVCAFAALRDDKPVDMAVRAARALRDQHGARVVMHLAPLRVRPGKDGRQPRLYGEAMEQSARWSSGGDFSGIRLTAAAAELLPPQATQPAIGDPGFRVLVEEPHDVHADEPALVGRRAFLDAAHDCLIATLQSQTPSLVTLLGDHGLGKSRMCRELAAAIHTAHPEVRVLSVRAGAEPGELLRRLEAMLKSVGGLAPSSREAAALEVADEDVELGAGSVARTTAAVRRLGRAMRRVASKAPLAVIIDDVHHAPDATLDAIEYATLDAPATSLWVAVTAHPRLERRRPQWGQRAFRHQRLPLPPLDESAAMTLAAALLRPVEYPPRATLALLAQWTGGNPQALVALVHTLVRMDIVRQGRQGGSWYLATAAIERLPASPVGQWLASRALAELPPDVAACARTCAVLGSELLRDELAWVQRLAERAGTAGTPVDTDVGLAALARAGVLEEIEPGIWRFVRMSLQAALYELIDPRDRVHVHAHALAFWQSVTEPADPERALVAIARHADATGARAVAVRANVDLGASAAAAWRDLDADRYYSDALAALDLDDVATAMRVLRARGRVRYRLLRVQDAIDDVIVARAHAEAAGDAFMLAHLLMDEATTLDWAEQNEASAACVARAEPLVARLRDPVLEGRLLMARGRSEFRAGRTAEAMDLLAHAQQLSTENSDDETRVIALLLLGPLYVLAEKLDEADRCFDEVIALCQRIGDRLHLCVAYNNRSYLWVARRSLQGIMADLGRARQISRESGWPQMEGGVTHNLAEFLHWSGAHENALALAQRAYALRRFLPAPVPADALLLARILVACDRSDEARSVMEEARTLLGPAGGSELERMVLRMLALCLAEDGGEIPKHAWEELETDARDRLPDEEYLEVLYFRGRAAARGERHDELASVLQAARERLDQCPIWQGPFASLAAAHPATHAPDDKPVHRRGVD